VHVLVFARVLSRVNQISREGRHRRSDEGGQSAPAFGRDGHAAGRRHPRHGRRRAASPLAGYDRALREDRTCRLGRRPWGTWRQRRALTTCAALHSQGWPSAAALAAIAASVGPAKTTANARARRAPTSDRPAGAAECAEQTDPHRRRRRAAAADRRRQFPFFLQFRFGANDGARAFGANDHEAAGAARDSARAVSVLPSIILANLGMETFDLALAVDRGKGDRQHAADADAGGSQK
jgi:hypothetical protein